MKVGFIGLGIMGSRMASNLLPAYPDLIVYNRDAAKMKSLTDKGAQGAGSVKDLVEQADIVITMLSTPQVVKEIATGENGILKNAKAGALWIDSTTVNPSFSREMAQAAQQNEIRFLEAVKK